jgi:hypothetical protein
MSTPKINAALLAVQRDITAIDKERKNQQQGYNFRGIDDVMNEIHPHFTKHGIFITTKVLDQKREERETRNGATLLYSILKIEFQFHAEDGTSVTCEMIGEGMDSGDKSANKAMSVALKYAILQMFTIPTADPKDPENDSPEPLPKKDRPMPGTKESKSFDDWHAVTWHLKFGAKKDKTFDYEGHTLAEIELNDPEGLDYWIRQYTSIGKAPEDILLREALDKAGKDRVQKESEPEKVASEDLPKHDTSEPGPKEKAIAELKELCEANHVSGKIIMEFGKKKGKIPKNAKVFADVDLEVIQAAIDKFQFFVDLSQEAK